MYAEKTNNLAIYSLIAGALSWIIAPILGSIAAVITGHVALRQIRDYGGESGRGVAYTGLVLGYANLIGFALLLIVGLWLVGLLGAGAYFAVSALG